nr:hypothetical protein [Tanacetum cinerariifolium]
LMESLSPQVVSAPKLPILNLNEFDLWTMRIEQYFLMTDYSLWEVILNDDKTLMEAIEKKFGGNKETKKLQKLISQLEILRESISQEATNLKLKIYEAEVKSSSIASPTTQNIAFVSSQNTDSTPESVSVIASVTTASAKVPIFALPNMDTLSDVVIYSFFASQSNSQQLDNDDLKQIDTDDIEEMDLKWQMAIFESDVSLPASPVYDRYQLGEGYHVFPPPYTRTFIPPKPDLSNRPSAPIIENWVSDSEDESEAEPTQNAPSFVPPPKHVKSLRLSVNPIEHPILAEHHRQEIPKSRGHQNSKNRKTCFVYKSLTHLIKDYDYYKKKMV